MRVAPGGARTEENHAAENEAPRSLLHGSLRFEHLLVRLAPPLEALGEAVAMDRARECQVLVREREGRGASDGLSVH